MDAELFEFAARLKKQGTMLCVPLGKSLGTALKRAGFHADQEVTVRFGQERLEILPRDTPREIQGKLKLAAGELKAFRKRMKDLATKLPAVSDEELEAEETLEGELLGMIECLVADDLDPAIHKLETVDELGPSPMALPGAPRGKRS